MLNTAYESNERPPSPDPARIAVHRDVVLYFGCPDVDGAYAHLRQMGLDIKKPKTAWYGMKQLYVADPDGYLLCFQWRAESSTANEESVQCFQSVKDDSMRKGISRTLDAIRANAA